MNYDRTGELANTRGHRASWNAMCDNQAEPGERGAALALSSPLRAVAAWSVHRTTKAMVLPRFKPRPGCEYQAGHVGGVALYVTPPPARTSGLAPEKKTVLQLSSQVTNE
jgi:hypothetical protein